LSAVGILVLQGEEDVNLKALRTDEEQLSVEYSNCSIECRQLMEMKA